MKASILDLRRRMGDVLRAIEKNEPVTLTYRGKVKGIIQPTKQRDAKAVTSHAAFGIWKDRKDMKSVDEVMDAIRRGRSHAV